MPERSDRFYSILQRSNKSGTLAGGLLDDQPNEVCNSQTNHQQQLLQKESDGRSSVSSDMLSGDSAANLRDLLVLGDSLPLVNHGSANLYPDCRIFQSISDDNLFAPTSADPTAEPVQVQSLDQVALESQSWKQTSEFSVQQTSAIEDSFQMIKMMKAKKPAATRYSMLPQSKQQERNNLISTSATSVSVRSEIVSPHQNRPLAQSPCSPLRFPPSRFQSLTPTTPVQVSVPSPACLVLMTPATSKRQFFNGRFKISSYLDGNCRIYEAMVREDLLDELKDGVRKMSSYSLETYQQYERCIGMPFDLNMAITTRAKLCKFVLEENSWKLTSTMPADCKYGNSLLCGSIRICILVMV